MTTFRRAAAPAAAALFLGSALIACGASDGTPGANQTATAEQGAEPQSQSSHPDPIATLEVAIGHTVEVYDFASRALVTESAKAETGSGAVLPAYADLIHSGHIADLFARLRPDLPVPAALRDAEARFVASAAAAPAEEVTQLPNVLPAAGPSTTGGGASASHGKYVPLDCGNGCCNDNYLRTQLCNYDLTQNLRWYNYDYGWSTEWATNIFHWDGTVCAAQGYSNYQVNIDGGNIWWAVQPGWYQSYWWTNCGNCGRVNANSTVNSQSNQNLHSYCGSVY